MCKITSVPLNFRFNLDEKKLRLLKGMSDLKVKYIINSQVLLLEVDVLTSLS